MAASIAQHGPFLAPTGTNSPGTAPSNPDRHKTRPATPHQHPNRYKTRPATPHQHPNRYKTRPATPHQRPNRYKTHPANTKSAIFGHFGQAGRTFSRSCSNSPQQGELSLASDTTRHNTPILPAPTVTKLAQQHPPRGATGTKLALQGAQQRPHQLQPRQKLTSTRH